MYITGPSIHMTLLRHESTDYIRSKCCFSVSQTSMNVQQTTEVVANMQRATTPMAVSSVRAMPDTREMERFARV
jgi:ApbE superfamily uncharacterized protein (UPF0280 family)